MSLKHIYIPTKYAKCDKIKQIFVSPINCTVNFLVKQKVAWFRLAKLCSSSRPARHHTVSRHQH
jgi:hypothetical protein